MTDRPDISVIVPVFNRVDVVGRAVRSLFDQKCRQSYEVIVVDDGSSDGSGHAATGIDSRVRVLRQDHFGAAAARATGIEAARAKIVAFLDSDDISEPWHLSTLWEALHRRQDIVLAWARVADLDANLFGRPGELEGFVDNGIMSDPLRALVHVGCFTASMCVMTYREIAQQAAFQRQQFIAANDYDFALRAALRGPFAFADVRIIRCDRRHDGICRLRGMEQCVFALIAAYEAVKESGRRDSALVNALRNRVEQLWPSASVKSARAKNWRLFGRSVAIGLKYAPTLKALRGLWWSWDATRRPLNRH